jgi:calcium binding protein 39
LQPTVDYVAKNPNILFVLLKGYEQQEQAIACGQMLRECAKFEPLARVVIQAEQLYDFYRYVEHPSFDVASDAFLTFKELLTKHKLMVATFLEANYARFFEAYTKLLNSENYVTKRQALKLLGELLLDRHNFTVMTQYISNAENLKLMMNLLKSKQKNIQFEAFHVFKVFVANPSKPRPIHEILLRNRDRLVEFLTDFQKERTDDEQFNDEKSYLIKQIKELKQLPPAPQ